ncbi:MAG: glucan 1,4-alpha-glucosidase [Gammaproteobacteria bacterium]|nr:MAG: glucan 1,4-alpha-glucosidase [Gammaproteobacteria bacterium]
MSRGSSLSALLMLGGALLGLAACDRCDCEPPKDETPAYLDTHLPLDARVDDLIGRLTLAEKLQQLYNETPAIERLGIPAYDWWNEALHGVARAGKATVFPQAIGLAASFDPALLGRIAEVISDEARAKHHHFARHGVYFRYSGLTFWSPNINIFRDPRWGRGQETYGEDPHLTATLATSFIRGMQGDHPHYLKTAAMAKHFAVHNGPEKSRHSDDYAASPKDLWETYLPAFEAAVTRANVAGVMCAYNRVNGDPACGSRFLLQETLRERWGFDGYVVSDCGAVADFYFPTAHALVNSPAEAAAWALKTGTDLNCGDGRQSTYASLLFALQRGMVEERHVDAALRHLFGIRFRLGQFDPPDQVPYTDLPLSIVGRPEHLELAQTMAERSLVLLKNDGMLPLPADIKVAVIGPNAVNPDVLLGNYHGDPIDPVLPLDGIVARLGAERVEFAPGSPLIGDLWGHYRPVPPTALFHRKEDGTLAPGLEAAYHALDENDEPETEPRFVRIDPNIDFHWQYSPLDERTVRGEFAVRWRGVLVPPESGTWRFDTGARLRLDGKEIDGPVVLEGGRAYALEAEYRVRHVWWEHRQPLEPWVKLSWAKVSGDFTADALAAARRADVVLFMGGLSPRLEGEEMPVSYPGFDHGDRTDLRLPAEQRALLAALKATGKPIVLVNFSGSAVALNWEDEHLDAIVQAFYPGERTGTALARLLWGEVNPSGRLPVTVYRGLDDLPDFKDYRMDKGRTYKYYAGKPLYPFGYGLSYSRFTYRDLVLPERHDADAPLPVRVTVENAGPMDGADVTQVYLAMPDAPVVVPRRQLAAFLRNPLAAGERRELTVLVDPAHLRYVDADGERRPYQGRLLVSIGSGQPGEREGAGNVLVGEVRIETR